MKNRFSVRALCCVLALLMLTAMLDACGSSSKPKLEKNTRDDAETYPYVVHTASATWYLAAADIALMGEDAFYEGFYKLLENQEADFADAREALKGYIDEEIPPIEIRTDFSGRAEASQIYGAYYHQNRNYIKLFRGWDVAAFALLHEYVHYLTVHCTSTPATRGFYAEAVANYLPMIVCHSRMVRSVNCAQKEEDLAFYQSKGAWDESEDCLDPQKFMFGTATMYALGGMIGYEYYSVSDVMELRTAPLADPLIWHVSHFEAGCLMAYLVETYGKDTVFKSLSTAPEDFESVYGVSFDEVYQRWEVWNLQKCEELGLTVGLE